MANERKAHPLDEVLKRHESQLGQLLVIRDRIPNTTFIIERSKNKNVVVYEAKVGSDGKPHAEKPLEVYWQDIDPAYVAANRKKGKMDDREDLNMIESTMAYGISTKPHEKHRHHHRVNCVAIKDKQLVLYQDDHGRCHIRTTINGKEANLVRVYVHSVERMFLPMPKIEYVEFFGFTVDTHEFVVEKVVP